MGAGEGGTLPARGSQIGRGEGGWLLTLPPPRSLEEPRITPGGPPSPALLELRGAHFCGLQRVSSYISFLTLKMSTRHSLLSAPIPYSTQEDFFLYMQANLTLSNITHSHTDTRG